MKRLVTGILAHVDSGKTTLSEGLLFTSGAIRKLGRVDHRDAFLDTNRIEREKGITIFSKQAVFDFNDTEITLLDTPGHVDFSAETERTLSVLDYAVLVISGSESVQSHTETLWQLLNRYEIPTFIFVNKMDMPGADKNALMSNLRAKLSDACVDFTDDKSGAFYEEAALCSESMMDELMETEKISENSLINAIKNREMFPCMFGSALKLQGVEEFLTCFTKYTVQADYGEEFGAKIFKISEDEKGQRLTHMRITGGVLKIRSEISGEDWSEKVNDIRVYSGAKFKSVTEALPGMVVAVAGLAKTRAGEGLGTERNSQELTLEPVFSYRVRIPRGRDIPSALADLKKLEEEETQLNVVWNEHLREIGIRLMGEVQLEVLKTIIAERFDMDVEFEDGSIIYRETITNTVEGVGHYEPLRHYAEVHLLLEPNERGKGLEFETACSEDLLNRSWQRLVLTHLAEKTHIGVLTGSPITDIKITLVSGRAHVKHTEGGDFRQATYRAVRQGLMQAESVLLEPWYDFKLTLPSSSIGRAMNEIQLMGGTVSPPDTVDDEMSVITGSAPISKMHNYQADVTAYTRGKGTLVCNFGGYRECVNAEEVIEKIGYDYESDLRNSPDSVFCTHGAGYYVPWYEVFNHMHLELMDTKKEEPEPIIARHQSEPTEISEEDLVRIFEKTYGKINRSVPQQMKTIKSAPQQKKFKARPRPQGPEYLLIDGYNIIFAWEDLTELAKTSLEAARDALIDRVAGYRAMKKINVILVFDAYKVKGNRGEVEEINGVTVVYTKEAETADAYIERVTHELGKRHRVRVATSDNLEQLIILGNGALRITAREFLAEIEQTEAEIRKFIEEYNTRTSDF